MNWLQSYLCDRYQTVIINDAESKRCKLQYGVPQGSVLGPILFNMYTAPLSSIIDNHGLKHHSYADDTQVYLPLNPRSPTELQSAVIKLEACLSDIKSWMQCNMLKVNAEKTEFMYVCTKHQCSKWQPPTITFDNTVLSSSSSAKNLGVVIDSFLNMDAFVDSICQSASFHLYNIWRIRDHLDRKTSEKVIHALISSRLDYCNSLLFGISKSSLHKLQLIQNRAARILFNKSKYAHVTPILKELHWLPISFRIIYKILLLVYKGMNNLAPRYLSDLLVPYVPARNLRSSDKCLLRVPATKLKSFGDKTFKVAGPRLWNELPLSIQKQPSVDLFKAKLKTHLFQQAFF